jgi:hypothetical protein
MGHPIAVDKVAGVFALEGSVTGEEFNQFEAPKRDVKMWERELREAGWRKHKVRSGRTPRRGIWQSLDGDLFLGPYGAWKEMKRRKA